VTSSNSTARLKTTSRITRSRVWFARRWERHAERLFSWTVTISDTAEGGDSRPTSHVETSSCYERTSL